MNLIFDYFTDLSKLQKKQLESMFELYKEWNEQINLISRKDMDYFYLHHVLHSLSIAKFLTIKSGSKIMDIGTGGGFPGIPLAILFPEVAFHLVDSTGKKIKVINSVKDTLGLNNVNTYHQRTEDLDLMVDFVVCRAVAPMETLMRWSADKISKNHKQAIKNGFLCLKGGNLTEELSAFNNAEVIGLSEYFNEPFFETKKLVYCPVN
ncbi:16S rRNA (guanine(527)-N(7))-methyltransferase RsmG [Flavobacteriaceae bacterium]|nr:16S rRNA (guanine(527)-N(7))-methyltransferase RsmG [Flavobacteriaceae bacterium]